MGNCFCQLHIHPDKHEIINRIENQEYNNTFPLKEINSQISNNPNNIKFTNPKMNILELNIKNKLLELGHFIQINDFKRLIGNEIVQEIQSKKFDYKQYINLPNSKTIKLNPFQFTDSKNIYCGSWNEEAEMEGEGIFYSYNNKIIIEGVWAKGDNICGRIFSPNKDKYEGAITNSLPNGKGILFFGNGDIFKGEFQNGDIVIGEFIFADDGTKYEGNFQNGNFHGSGKMTWENNIEYKGNFQNSMLFGKGKLIKTIDIDKKEIYEGDFYENEFNGKGKYNFDNGDIYEGDYEFGVKKGHGIYKRNNGDIIEFEGKWNDDLPNGNGVLSYGGYKLKGFWRNGDYMNSTEEENEIFNNIDKNIKPQKISLFPTSLSHLNMAKTNISQISQEFV